MGAALFHGFSDAELEKIQRTRRAVERLARQLHVANGRTDRAVPHQQLDRPGDRANEPHSTPAEAIEVAKAADARSLVLIHISTRYPKRQIESMIRNVAREQTFDRPLTMVMARYFTPILGAGGRGSGHSSEMNADKRRCNTSAK